MSRCSPGWGRVILTPPSPWCGAFSIGCSASPFPSCATAAPPRKRRRRPSCAWRHAGAYDPRRGTVAAWLLTIARNVSINMLPTRRFDPIDPEILLALEAKRPHRAGTEAQVVDAELLREQLARLPQEQRRALVLAVFYGFTAREISQLDGLPLGTVKTRIRSAMLKLRSQLKVPDER
jgi:RNA polymerase sigma factor (sigma-70 family)